MIVSILKNSYTRWGILIVIGTIVICFLAQMMMIKPLEQDLQELEREKQQLTEYTNPSDHLSDLMEETTVWAKIPGDQKLNNMMDEFQLLQNQYQVSIENITVEDEGLEHQEYNAIQIIRFNIEGTASNYQEFQQFLASLDVSERILHLSEIDFESDPNQASISFSIQFDAYFAPAYARPIDYIRKQ
ncbi:type 4a pilus biogenesis protein PilO [Gracilibacillus sp. YIM 98692]|uniref:type 4a pilus biogenesis protein PilO n=1 Tax=Gracilibacillus sp. YIM 98692 TaxID=2663532 RepID=UPI0013D8D973|nr:type 4a pilus biogenesis protein PilO [Gracilibacillus sp. YIM 98692]